MGSGVHIKASEQYFDYNTSDNITLSLTVSEIHQKWTYCSFRVQVEGEGVWSSRITNIAGSPYADGGTKLLTNIRSLISQSEYNSGIRKCKVKCCGLTAKDGVAVGWTENEIEIYVTEPLAKPKITSILPKSPKISECLTVKWNAVSKANYYTLKASRFVGNIEFETTILENIQSGTGDTVSVTTPPIQNLGVEQSGFIKYCVCARSNDNRYTESKSDYVTVNLNLASNLRFKLSGEWIRGKPYIKVGGKWRRAVKTYIKVNGKWVNA